MNDGRTHNAEVTSNQKTELATLARKWLAPSTYHNIYVVENKMVHAALKQNIINLFKKETIAFQSLFYRCYTLTKRDTLDLAKSRSHSRR
jgi:hypothetical protein